MFKFIMSQKSFLATKTPGNRKECVHWQSGRTYLEDEKDYSLSVTNRKQHAKAYHISLTFRDVFHPSVRGQSTFYTRAYRGKGHR